MIVRSKRHDSSSDEEEDENADDEFRRKKRRSEGGNVRDRRQETPSYTGGVSREAKERQVSQSRVEPKATTVAQTRSEVVKVLAYIT